MQVHTILLAVHKCADLARAQRSAAAFEGRTVLIVSEAGARLGLQVRSFSHITIVSHCTPPSPASHTRHTPPSHALNQPTTKLHRGYVW